MTHEQALKAGRIAWSVMARRIADRMGISVDELESRLTLLGLDRVRVGDDAEKGVSS